jgi:transposase
MIDARSVPEGQEDIPTGEAVAGMLLNGLGFSARPLSLPPQFFATKPVALLLREGVSAEHCNRFKLGRSLDKVCAYGCDVLGSDIALPVGRQEGIALRFNRLDTTSFALPGAYEPETATQAIAITHGSSKDHRPDLTQAVLALLVSQDGGGPLFSQRWDGNASDNIVFKERCEALIAQCKARESPRYLIAASQVYPEAHAATLAWLRFMTRIPETLQVTQQVSEQAWAWGLGQPLEETTSSPQVDLCH